MEQGGQAEDGVLRSQLQPLLVDRGREDHIAVGVGGRLRGTGGAGGVDHQGDVVAGEFQRWWNRVVVLRQQVQQPNAAGTRCRFDSAEQRRVVGGGQEVARRGGDRRFHRGGG